MGYKLELGAWSAVFAVPNALVRSIYKEADGDQLKVMLWLLRHNGRPYARRILQPRSASPRSVSIPRSASGRKAVSFAA